MTTTFPAVIAQNAPNLLHNKSHIVNLLPITFPGLLTPSQTKTDYLKNQKNDKNNKNFKTPVIPDFEFISTLPLTNCAIYQQNDTIREVIRKTLAKNRRNPITPNPHQRDWLKLFKICYSDARGGGRIWFEDAEKMVDFDYLQNQGAGNQGNQGFYELRIRLHLVNEQLSRLAVEDKETLDYYRVVLPKCP